jgi:hypothetical protein
MKLYAVLSIGAALAGCTAAETVEYPSPDGKLIARLIDDRGGGPATSAYQTIEIVDADSGERQRVFEGENISGRRNSAVLFGDINVSWSEPRILLIAYCSGKVTASMDRFNLSGTRGRVKLVREQRGEWPSSVPADRRNGPPPCI